LELIQAALKPFFKFLDLVIAGLFYAILENRALRELTKLDAEFVWTDRHKG
jgi:hypothetical protein